jgi:hypothetical protein
MSTFGKELELALAKGLTAQYREISRVRGKDKRLEWESMLSWKKPEPNFDRRISKTDLWGDAYDHAIPWGG